MPTPAAVVFRIFVQVMACDMTRDEARRWTIFMNRSWYKSKSAQREFAGRESVIVELFKDRDTVNIYRLYLNVALKQEIISREAFHRRIVEGLLVKHYSRY